MDLSFPCGVYNTSYSQDLAIVRTRIRWVGLAAVIALTFLTPLMVGYAWMGWVLETCIVIIAVLGLYLVIGLCGQVSLGQAGFMAVGAYSTAILMTQLGISYWLALVLAILITSGVALIFGIPSLRVKGIYLAMATLASQYVIVWVITHPPLYKLSGGFDGMTTPSPTLGPVVFNSYSKWFLVVNAFMWGMIFFSKNISRTRVGRAFVAIRDSELAAEVLGIHIFRYKLLAFFLSGIFAGLAGALFAPYIVRISPENFNLEKSLWYLGMLIVGGSFSVLGAVIGTIFIRFLLEIAVILGPSIHVIPIIGPHLANYLSGIVFGLVIIIFLVFEPRGLEHRWGILKASYRLHPFSY